MMRILEKFYVGHQSYGTILVPRSKDPGFQEMTNHPVHGMMTKGLTICDPRGFEFSTNSDNLSDMLAHSTVVNGIFTKPCLYVVNNGQVIITVVGSRKHQKALDNEALKKSSIPVSELIPGHEYLCQNGKTITWLGEWHVRTFDGGIKDTKSFLYLQDGFYRVWKKLKISRWVRAGHVPPFATAIKKRGSHSDIAAPEPMEETVCVFTPSHYLCAFTYDGHSLKCYGRAHQCHFPIRVNGQINGMTYGEIHYETRTVSGMTIKH